MIWRQARRWHQKLCHSEHLKGFKSGCHSPLSNLFAKISTLNSESSWQRPQFEYLEFSGKEANYLICWCFDSVGLRFELPLCCFTFENGIWFTVKSKWKMVDLFHLVPNFLLRVSVSKLGLLSWAPCSLRRKRTHGPCSLPSFERKLLNFIYFS